MAEHRQDNSLHLQNTAGSRPSSATREDRETRIKTFKERQNEERQKKLDEMKNQAMAAQRFKEQKESERRQRLEELRVKEDERRLQVEERKRAINEAERDRLESILKRNQEREARIEAKRKNERSSLVFAFGSSTPRVLGPTETTSSFWGQRRATSTQNITYSAAPLTRRQSERELDGGSKKRATSAGGLERSEDDMRMSTSMYEVVQWGHESDLPKSPNPPNVQEIVRSNSANFGTTKHPAGCTSGYVGRRRTDLMPTIPTKEMSSNTPRKSFMRSPAPSRPSSSLSQQSTSSVTSSVILRSRPIAAPRRQRPASIAVTGISIGDLKNITNDLKKQEKPPLPKSRKSSFAKSQEKIIKKKSLASPTEGSPRSVTSPIAAPPSTIESYNNNTQLRSSVDPEQKPSKNTNGVSLDINEKENVDMNGQNSKEEEPENNAQVAQVLDSNLSSILDVNESISGKSKDTIVSKVEQLNLEVDRKSMNNSEIINKSELECAAENQSISELSLGEVDMNASINSKPRITTEEEAKAALAERRRIAREEAERQAENERLRKEEEIRLELERQQKEEEQQRQLIELQRSIEEERLKEAIRETQRREEELKQKREEEQRTKLLKEEADKKAREEAEKQKAELQERLKNEEKEREVRRKRVEAIMSRTRAKNNSGNLPQTEEKNVENKLDSNKVNGSNSDSSENGHKNGKDIETVDNIIPVNTIKNANTVNTTSLHTEDTLNSNDAWQRNSQTDLLM